jgi:hypothetical protein
VTNSHAGEVKLRNSGTYEDKLSKMNMDAELSASFLSGMINVGGAGRYLTDTRESNRILQASLHYNITTVNESMNFMSTELKKCLTLNALQSGAATHVVAGIGWGANSVVMAKHRLSIADDRAKIEGQFQAELNAFKSFVEVAGGANLGLDAQQRTEGMSFEVSVYDDVLANDGLLPTDLPSAYKFISNISKYIASANGGRGKPLAYTLLPLSMLAYLLQLEKFVQLFDGLKNAQQKLNDHYLDIWKHKFCVPRAHRQDFKQCIKSARVAEATLSRNILTF